MALIRVRFAVNEGGLGAPLDKLADVAQEAERFLRMLAADLKMENTKGDWLAVNFRNGSVSFDAAFESAPSIQTVHAYTAALRAITDFDPVDGVRHPDVSERTLEQFCRLGEIMAPHERLGIGLYNGKAYGDPEEWKYVTRGKITSIKQELERPLLVFGSIQGIIHSWFKESDPPCFNLREAASNTLVKCFYPDELYATLVAAFHERSTVVHAAGMGRFVKGGRSLTELRLERLEAVRPLSEEEFDSLFGIAPDFTGDMTTGQYIESIRAGWD
jgi:hypothetical protein